ncbi:MAG: ABC transporter substrate binding protein [Syntrophomonadaceae bacterium]|jgi:putative ABC transport system substrate-binding protein
MKRLVKSVVILICLSLLMTSVVGCASNQKETGESPQNDKKLQIGIVQIVEHPSLNTIRESFIQELAQQGFKDGEKVVIDYQNAQGDQTNLKTICQKFANSKYDLIVAIATPSAQAAVGETKEIPIVFSACTDPVGSGLVSDLEKPGQNVTGTSDAVSAEKIMELARRITPDIKTVGALYTSSETNSVSVVNNLKEYAAKNGLTVVEATVTNSSEVQQAVTSLVGKADAVFSPIDNTVASAMPLVAQVANKAKKPVYVGADSMVKDGGLATFGINYTILGQETAKMAAQILNGQKAGDIPVKTMTDMDIYVNKDTAAAIGVSIPDDVLKEATVFGN